MLPKNSAHCRETQIVIIGNKQVKILRETANFYNTHLLSPAMMEPMCKNAETKSLASDWLENGGFSLRSLLRPKSGYRPRQPSHGWLPVLQCQYCSWPKIVPAAETRGWDSVALAQEWPHPCGTFLAPKYENRKLRTVLTLYVLFFFNKNINEYLQIRSFIHIDITHVQVVEIFPPVRQGRTSG